MFFSYVPAVYVHTPTHPYRYPNGGYGTLKCICSLRGGERELRCSFAKGKARSLLTRITWGSRISVCSIDYHWTNFTSEKANRRAVTHAKCILFYRARHLSGLGMCESRHVARAVESFPLRGC